MIPEGSRVLRAFSFPQHIAVPVRRMRGFSVVGQLNESKSVSSISRAGLWAQNPCWELSSQAEGTSFS